MRAKGVAEGPGGRTGSGLGIAALVAGAVLGWGIPAALAIEIAIGVSFSGTSSDETGYDPPDTMGAVGEHHVVELMNGQFAVYRKSDGERIQRKALNDFWADSGVRISAFAFDPRILYDAEARRWIGVAADNLGRANGLLIAVSESDDPTGNWRGFKLDTHPSGRITADFPMLGMTADAIIVAANTFQVQSEQFVGGALLVAPKADLYASPASLDGATFLNDLALEDFFLFSQPVVDYDGASGPVMLVADFPTQGKLIASRVVWRKGVPRIGSVHARSVQPFGDPVAVDQPGPHQALDAGKDSRFGSSVVMRNGSVWAVSTVEVHGRSALRWFEIDPNDLSVRRAGVLADPDLAFFYGSIAVNEFDEIVIGCNGAGPSRFASSYAFVGTRGGGEVKFSDPILLREGTSSYVKTKDGRNRWGDYSATLPDPYKPHSFWTLQQVATGPQAWAVEITEILVDPYLVPRPAPGIPAPPFQELGAADEGPDPALKGSAASDSLDDSPEKLGPTRERTP